MPAFMNLYYTLLVIPLFAAVFLGYPWCRDRWILSRPFPAHWLEVLDRNVPFYSRLSADEQTQLKSLMQLFIARKHFHGCGGLEMTDEIKVTIAAQACLLVLNRDTGLYPGLQHILVYPSAFRVNHARHSPEGIVSQDSVGLLGESWSNGKVILSWDNVISGVSNFEDGHNVALHEFSHQLDSESGTTNGAPLLRHNCYRSWASVLGEEFEQLTRARDQARASLMDQYGASNPAEFFAVATETFFEKPQQMASTHPALFSELQNYYRVDPRKWQ